MLEPISRTDSSKRKLPNKLIAGFAAFAATGIMAASGLAGATPINKPTDEDCKKAGYSNHGQCVSNWAKNKPKPGGGHGYGGGNASVGTNINLTLNNSNNNVFQIIVHVFSH